MAPETHTRYRVQRLIRKGEWLDRNADALVAFFDALDTAHDQLLEAEDTDMTVYAIGQMTAPLKALWHLTLELRHDSMCRDIQRGTDVTIHHPYAVPGKEWEVVIEAPKPKDIPSQEEFNRVRAEVDITA